MKMTRDPPANVLARVHNSNELMRLLHYLHGAPTGSVQTVCIPYLPYARQDRPTDKGTHNAVEVLAARESKSRPAQGIVTFEHRAYNQSGDLVCRAVRDALMHKEPAD